MEKSDTSEYQPTDQEESEALQTDDELVETSDEDQLISTMRDKIFFKKREKQSQVLVQKKERKKGKLRQKKGKRESRGKMKMKMKMMKMTKKTYQRQVLQGISPTEQEQEIHLQNSVKF